MCTFFGSTENSEEWEYSLGNISPDHRYIFTGRSAGRLVANTCHDGTIFKTAMRLYRRPIGSSQNPGGHVERSNSCARRGDGAVLTYDMSSDSEDYEYILIVESRRGNIPGDDYALILSWST